MAKRMPHQTDRLHIRIDQLLLDPNNYRFRDQDRWIDVPEDRLGDPAVQRQARALIQGHNQEGIYDLVGSLRANGWLDIDQIQVRPYGDGRFVVVEGNRRVATLELLHRRFEDEGEPLGAIDPSFFNAVPVVVQERGNRVQHLVNMGLVHITGKRQWSQLAQSLAIRELIEDCDLSEHDVRRRLSISTKELRLSLRALHLCDAYKASDYGDQFSTERYTLLREAVRIRSIKPWIAWDDITYQAANKDNQERLFALISVIEEELDLPEDNDQEMVVKREPALRTRDQVRRLGKLLEANDDRAVCNLEKSRDLTAAESASDQLGRDRVRNAVALIGDQANQLFNSASFFDDTHAAQLIKAVRKLAGVWVAAGRDTDELRRGIQVSVTDEDTVEAATQLEPDYPTPDTRHLTTLVIKRYRGITDIALTELRRINVLAGLNNAGKTSILECVRLLVSQSEPAALFDIVRRRGRMQRLDWEWAAHQLPVEAHIIGKGVRDSRIVLKASDAHAMRTRLPGYLKSLEIRADLGEGEQRSTTHLYTSAFGRTTERDGRHQLGPLVHSSPFSSQDPEVLAQLFDAAVVAGLDRCVQDELRRLLDPGIQAIKLTSGPPPRFRVSRSDTPPPDGMDLAMYGDGLQRLFHIGLLFAHARDGFVLIDELENGVHAGLLPALARMVHTFAVRFNVQVFIATHSKECIDAFVKLDDVAQDLRGFSLGFDADGRRAVEGIDGEKLAELVRLIDADLRSYS